MEPAEQGRGAAILSSNAAGASAADNSNANGSNNNKSGTSKPGANSDPSASSQLSPFAAKKVAPRGGANAVGHFMGSINPSATAQVDASLAISTKTDAAPSSRSDSSDPSKKLAQRVHHLGPAVQIRAALFPRCARPRPPRSRDSSLSQPTMLGFQQGGTQQHHLNHPQLILSTDEGIHGGGGSDSADNYLRKRFRDDLFKEDNPPAAQHSPDASSSASASKTMRTSSVPAVHLQQRQQEQMGLIRPSNVMPAAAMWAVAAAPAPSSGGGAFWMLPVTAGSNSPAVATGAGPSEPSIWTFPAAGQYRTSIQPGSGTLQAPLHFMPRINTVGPLPLGSMLVQQPAAGGGATSQHLGLGISETNLGMLAALNAYNRGGGGGGLSMNSEQQQQQQQSLDHHQSVHAHTQQSDDSEDHQTSSQ
ncbi:hypothetical protein H6P81_015463 [Aristolochia fimbriata]|uniref:Uncharacterized protein n=1 Tax=Aristolochia fimbriata TaxID=158543 RepID=A0AAV7EA85_ARIFI|nr:hypothetical protein H6P81_015463 [Aristolochia fimbriata]